MNNNNTYQTLLLFILTSLFSPTWADTDTCPPVYGLVENVTLLPEGLTLPTKLDTGAETASVNAINIEEFSRNNNAWVRFDIPIPDSNEVVSFERQLVRYAHIKSRATTAGDIPPPIQRPVVQLTIAIGDETRDIEVNLTNRQHFTYPMLLGSRAIAALGAAINPALSYTRTTHAPE